jgi:apolipoprotein N-acyltransferase
MTLAERVGSRVGVPASYLELTLRIVSGTLLATLSGVVATLAFPPYEIWPLIFIAFIPMVVAQHRVLPLNWSAVAPGVTIGVYFAGQLSGGLADGNVPFLIELWPVYVMLLIGGLAWLQRKFHVRTEYRWLALTLPVAWTGVDAARAFTGIDVLAGTWGNVAYALYEQAWLLQPLAVFGIFGAELLILMINFAIAHAVIAGLDSMRPPRALPVASVSHALWSVLGVGILVIGWIVSSLFMFQPQPGTMLVGTVQSNVLAGEDERFKVKPEEELKRVIAATRELGRQGAKVIVWREGGLKFDPTRERTDELKALAAETGAHLAVGYGVKEPSGLRRNEAVVFAPNGDVFGPYGKAHPGRFAGDHSDTGGEYKVYDTALGKIATIICYDLDFTDTAREMTRRGATFIAVPSNDVPAIATTHYTHLVFRAIENRMPLAKADSLFDTAIIDPWGQILARNVNDFTRVEALAASEARRLPAVTLLAAVPLGTGDTISVRLGDWIGWLALLATIGLVTYQIVGFFRARSS